jgi:preprotein translocase subunit SecA
VIQYDDVINKQREVVYAQRRRILEQPDLKDIVMDMVDDEIEALVKEHTDGDLPENWDLHGLLNEVRPIVPLPREFDVKTWERGTRDEITESLQAEAETRYDAGLTDFGGFIQTQMTLAGGTYEQMKFATRDPLQRSVYTWAVKLMGQETVDAIDTKPLNAISEDLQPNVRQSFVDGVRLFRDRVVLIQIVDDLWVKHLTDLDELREGIGLRAYAQKDPLVAYRTEASNVYNDMLGNMKQQVAQRIFNVQFNVTGAQPANGNGAVPQGAAGAGQRRAVQPGAKLAGTGTIDRAINRAQVRASGGGSVAPQTKPKPASAQKIGRNDVCPFCSQGKKIKNCDCVDARKWRGEL